MKVSQQARRLFPFGCPTLADFEKHALRAKELGATRVMGDGSRSDKVPYPFEKWTYE